MNNSAPSMMPTMSPGAPQGFAPAPAGFAPAPAGAAAPTGYPPAPGGYPPAPAAPHPGMTAAASPDVADAPGLITDFSQIDPSLFAIATPINEQSSMADITPPPQPGYYVVSLGRIKEPKRTKNSRTGEEYPGEYKPTKNGVLFGYMQIAVKITAGFDVNTRQPNPNNPEVGRTFNNLISTMVSTFTNTSMAHDLIGACTGKKNHGYTVVQLLQVIDSWLANEANPPQTVAYLQWTLSAPEKNADGSYEKPYKRSEKQFKKDPTTGMYIPEYSHIIPGVGEVPARTQVEVAGFFSPNAAHFARR